MKRLAFVLPRFGVGFMGGAESLCGELAQELAKSGYEVEILTTCARDNRTWDNELPSGLDRVFDIAVRRFPVSTRDLETWVPLQIALSQGRQLSLEEQFSWMQHSVISHELFSWISKYGQEYDALIFAPYLFGTTFWGSQIHPDRSILLPCLHDEAYAYVDIIAEMFRSVRGCIFNAAAEQRLCRRLYGDIRGGVVGMGFEPEPSQLPEARLHDRPYVLYVGRKETGKNVHLLVDLFRWYLASDPSSELDLLIVGGGDFGDLHRNTCGRVVDMPRVSEVDKQRLMRDAVALVQPSVNESFSIVLMEAWRVGTPVIVNGNCAVTREHVEVSGGGLYFENEMDFFGVVDRLANDSVLNRALAVKGWNYVQSEYRWKAVVSRFESILSRLLSQSLSEPPAPSSQVSYPCSTESPNG